MIEKFKRIPHYARPKIEKLLSEGLAWAYSSPDGWLQRAAVGPLLRLHQYEQWIANHHMQGQAYITSGLSVRNGQPLKVAILGGWIAGKEMGLSYYEHAFFQEGTTERHHMGSFPAGQYRRWAERLAREVDMVAFVDSSILMWEPPTGEWVLGPSDVRMAFDFTPGQSWTDTIKRVDQEYNLRVLKKSGLTYRISVRKEDFLFFYHNMHVPLIKSRYKDFGSIPKEKDLDNILKNKHGFVMLIEDADGNPVGGGLDFIWRDVFFSYVNGVLDGSPELIKKGALTAWYYFGMRMAYERGCKRFDSGLCRAYLSDGVYIHKHRWGEEASPDYWNHSTVLLWAPSGSPVALDWMKSNPLIPRLARWGGAEMTAFYRGLQQSQAEPKISERKSVSKPVESDPEKPDYRFEAFDQAPEGVREALVSGACLPDGEQSDADQGEEGYPLTLVIRNAKDEIIGGLLGSFAQDFLQIHTLWIAEAYNQHGLGTRLLRIAENAARLHGAQRIILETPKIQVVEFCHRFGYAEIGEEESLPERQNRYSLQKMLPDEVEGMEYLAVQPGANGKTQMDPMESSRNGNRDPSGKLTGSGMKQPIEKTVKEKSEE